MCTFPVKSSARSSCCMPVDQRAYLADIVESCDAIQSATRTLDLQSYQQNRLVRSAVEREFIIICEAVAAPGRIAPSTTLWFGQLLRPTFPFFVGNVPNLSTGIHPRMKKANFRGYSERITPRNTVVIIRAARIARRGSSPLRRLQAPLKVSFSDRIEQARLAVRRLMRFAAAPPPAVIA